MATNRKLRRLIRLAAISGVAALSLVAVPTGAQATAPTATEAAVVDSSTPPPIHDAGPIVGTWKGSLGGAALSIRVYRVSFSSFRADSITPIPGCRIFDVTGRGNFYKGTGFAENCDGTGESFAIAVEISSDARVMTISPPGGVGEPLVLTRVS